MLKNKESCQRKNNIYILNSIREIHLFMDPCLLKSSRQNSGPNRCSFISQRNTNIFIKTFIRISSLTVEKFTYLLNRLNKRTDNLNCRLALIPNIQIQFHTNLLFRQYQCRYCENYKNNVDMICHFYQLSYCRN